MKQGKKKHTTGELHKARARVKEVAGEVTTAPNLRARTKTKSRATKTRYEANPIIEVVERPAPSPETEAVASETPGPPESMVARIAQWPRSVGAWSKALVSSLLRMTRNLFAYLGSGIRSISTLQFYRQRSSQAA